MPKVIEGTWPENDIRRAFVAGAKWWEFHKTEFTMWNSDRRLAEKEAEKRYSPLISRTNKPKADALETGRKGKGGDKYGSFSTTSPGRKERTRCPDY